MSKPGIDELLIKSAMEADFRRLLTETPDRVFGDFDLSEDEKEILRHPDHRLLRLLGAAIDRQSHSVSASSPPAAIESQAPTVFEARTLPETSVALTVVPCAQYHEEQFKGFSYVVWVNPLAPGADPASLPPPPGAVLTGRPLAPLYAVIQVSAVQFQHPEGEPQLGLWASLKQSSNVHAPPQPEAAGNPEAPPFGSDLASETVQAAVTAVRSASKEDRYARILDLTRALKTGDVR